MINSLNGIIGCLYYQGQAEQGRKISKEDKTFNNMVVERVTKVQKMKKQNEFNKQEKEIMPTEFFSTEIVADEGGRRSIVLLANNQRCRQINLEGESNESDISLKNPAKIKAAYFNDDL